MNADDDSVHDIGMFLPVLGINLVKQLCQWEGRVHVYYKCLSSYLVLNDSIGESVVCELSCYEFVAGIVTRHDLSSKPPIKAALKTVLVSCIMN